MPRTMLGALLCSFLAAPVSGQTLRDSFQELFNFGDCGDPLCLPVAASVHGSHYNPDVVQGRNNLLGFLTSAIGTSVSNIPIASGSSGQTVSFQGGVPVATSVSSGPIFAERSQTLGRGILLFGANVTALSFSELRGVSLSDLSFNFTHQNVGQEPLGDPLFETDVIEVSTSLDLSLIVTSFFATYGIADKVDLSVAIPFVNASLTGNSLAQINQSGPSSPHFFGSESNPSIQSSADADGSAAGLGDITARIKVNLSQSDSRGLALLADVRLPTGSDDDFLGSGATTYRGLGVFSASAGNFSPHINAGFVASTSDLLANAVVGAVGFDQLVASWATLAVDVIGNIPVGNAPIELPQEIVFDLPARRTVDLSNIPDLADNLIDASFGLKFQTSQGLRVVTNALVPLSSGGMRSAFSFTAGVEYTIQQN